MLLSDSPVQPCGDGVKQLFRQFVLSSQKKQLCWGTLSVFLKLKGSSFNIKEVRRRCCPVTFAKFFKTVTQHLCVAASGASAILVMVEKPLRRDFLYYVYVTGMTIEPKLRSSATK